VPSLLLLIAASARAQQPASPPTAPALSIPAVGDAAPDFSIRGATRFGLVRDPMLLSGFRGQTVVLWFFIKARTRG
jgi:thioredoxin-dependent peroxiredoxin